MAGNFFFSAKKLRVIKHLSNSPRIKCQDDPFLLFITSKNPSFHFLSFLFPILLLHRLRSRKSKVRLYVTSLFLIYTSCFLLLIVAKIQHFH